jgi:hypothetical protein
MKILNRFVLISLAMCLCIPIAAYAFSTTKPSLTTTISGMALQSAGLSATILGAYGLLFSNRYSALTTSALLLAGLGSMNLGEALLVEDTKEAEKLKEQARYRLYLASALGFTGIGFKHLFNK